MTKQQREAAQQYAVDEWFSSVWLREYETALAACEKERDALRTALTMLYEETADYIRLNDLGAVHHNRSMRMARAALAPAQAEAPFNLPASKEDENGCCEACHEYPCRCD